MTTAPTELKPCPFCGGEAIRCKTAFTPSMNWVLCRDCQACPGERPTMAGAETLWNTRAPAALEPQAVDDAMVELAENAAFTEAYNALSGADHDEVKTAISRALSAYRAALQAAKEPSHD